MMTQAIVTLIPTFFMHWCFSIILASVAWLGWTRIYPQFKFKIAAPLLVGTAFTFFSAGNTLISMYQNVKLAELGRSEVTSKQAPNGEAQAQKAPVDPKVQMKIDFLKNVEALITSPDQINDENKKKLFSVFGSLFPKGEADKKTFAQNISAAYECQLHFWEDALASYRQKKTIKSDIRKTCEAQSGAFFERERLISVEASKSNEKTLEEIATRKKRVPAADGKEVEITETMLKDALDSQVKNLYNIKRIFD